MKAYSNKPERIDPKRCLYAEMRKNKNAIKKAERKRAKDEIKQVLNQQ